MQRLTLGVADKLLVSLFNGYGDAFLALPVLRAIRRRFVDINMYLACPSLQFRSMFSQLRMHHVPDLPDEPDLLRALLAGMCLTHFISFNAYYPCPFETKVRPLLSGVPDWGFCDKRGTPLLPMPFQREHMRDQYYRVVGWQPHYTLCERQPDIKLAEEQRMDSFLASATADRPRLWYALHVDTEREKMWPVERWCAVIHAIWLRWQAWPLIIGQESDDARELAVRCPFAQRLPADEQIDRAFVAVKAAYAFVGVDSIFAHVADSYNKPMVVLFGTSDPGVWGPRGPRAFVVEARGCGMQRITVEAVVDAIDRLGDKGQLT